MKKTPCILLIGASLLVTLVVESDTFEDQRCLASSMLFTQVKYVVRGERLLISKQARLSRGNPIHFYLGLLSSGERGGTPECLVNQTEVHTVHFALTDIYSVYTLNIYLTVNIYEV